MKQNQDAPRASRCTRWAARALLGSALLVTGTAWAATYTLTVKVTVVERTCDIYGNGGLGQPISVDLGDIIIKNIDGVSYKKTDIPYTLRCDDAASNPALKLKFDGSQMTGAAANVLKIPNNDNVGLRLLANGTNLNLGTWRNFNYNTQPTLSVVPVTNGQGGVNDGEFNASATLSVEYQ
ncbi:fimbrial protein [Providencia rettgeri]|uniref:Fimbrial protein n=1 Tax=Providencia stuartii TaxID=588 RepID=A0AAI9DBX4_PROST|nr:fimbrial protein [Providencia stuartii]MDV5227252.1 fimbrial protein [Providencia rettgeri]